MLQIGLKTQGNKSLKGSLKNGQMWPEKWPENAKKIIQAKRANEDLLNEKNTSPKWSIPGIYGANKIGKPSMATRMLKKSLNL